MVKFFKIFFIFFFILFFLFAGIYIYIDRNLDKQTVISKEISIEIKKGTSIRKISKLLYEKGIIKNKELFYLYSRFKNVPLKAGYYSFKGNYTIPDVWSILATGKERLFPLTVLPGENLFDIGKKIEKTFNIPKEKFLSFVFNPENLRKYDLTGLSFEGYIPPETYKFRKDVKIKEIMDSFIQLFKETYYPLLKKSKEFSPYQVMIIASMVEKEAFLEEEKPVIAGVIINRLKKGMLLQIDPTVIYALKLAGKWNGRITRKNIHFNSIYNTYVYKGLPPTPICSFSISSLKAVILYKKTPYLYYFTKNGREHIFSKTYKEHIKALKGR